QHPPVAQQAPGFWVQKVPPTPTPPVVEVDCVGVPPPVPPPLPVVPLVPPPALVPPPPVMPVVPPLVPTLPVVPLAELVPDVDDAVLEVDEVLEVEAVVTDAELFGGTVSDGAPVVSPVLLPPVLPQPPATRASTIPPTAIA
ncbi:MAG TPA: hypothetical protein VFP55_06395, partial [Solirubrobacteraceae bacterium]|nr:hypothetical protein [Solirubrobacteraceae bacterium]